MVTDIQISNQMFFPLNKHYDYNYHYKCLWIITKNTCETRQSVSTCFVVRQHQLSLVILSNISHIHDDDTHKVKCGHHHLTFFYVCVLIFFALVILTFAIVSIVFLIFFNFYLHKKHFAVLYLWKVLNKSNSSLFTFFMWCLELPFFPVRRLVSDGCDDATHSWFQYKQQVEKKVILPSYPTWYPTYKKG